MASILYKWFFIASMWIAGSMYSKHPVYMSVTEIEHNAKEKTLEISCKIFTDDFEKTLRAAYNKHVDLLKPSETAEMNKMVNDYLQKHFQVIIDGKSRPLIFKGFEQIEEAIYVYYQADNVPAVKKITVIDNILYDYKEQQMGILHITVNGSRKSTKLVNPEDKASFEW